MSDIQVMNATAQAEQSGDYLDQIIDNTQAIRRESDRNKVKSQLDNLLTEVASGAVIVSNDLVGSIEARIAAIDELLSSQVSKIIQAPEFQRMESSWRGLHKLVQSSVTENTKVRVFNCTKKELLRDFKSASDFDQSSLFKSIYESEYGTFGGDPYSAFVGDFEFDCMPEDVQLLEQISHVAAAAHAPFLSAANPGMFAMGSFSEMPRPRDLSKLFETSDYARWKSFRQSDDSRYVGLTLPRVIGRLPYGAKTVSIDAFNFEEKIDENNDGASYLWVNAAYDLAGRMVEAFEEYGWCAAIRGVEGGGLVKSLPAYNYISQTGEKIMQCPTEVAISDRREKELAELGFIPLIYCKGTDYAAFFAVQSANKPRKYDSELANANAKLSSQLQYIMTTSRFAHYLKSIVRDKVGSFMSKSECQNFLQNWINQYVVGSDNVGPTIKASHPLREAVVEVVDVPGSPGSYRAVAYLKPHFQLEGLSMSLRLVAELPASTGA
ncbi:type VI secretion system contractile sheath large subunit [Rahnella sp. C60]|uniref:Type VI secretion system contractile sheath large subunit n=1 Tax=Rahnella perminowiae TaxID=2816244 RepID=A0ABS6L3V8_9GAMM|nr:MULTISPECIES: type VI secretion system contractile sheath large subunit [Rahnella]UJD91826.1 type VI secretion system contractile sheath large subunit [Rahnella aquatilis]MBU9816229.1 type VI secretion system contractile sheath large subunit [Rahnella perminowiae]MBU9824259.1 type VI secretion system contractile sheath large subunit [Rahnella perminowiae]MBU9836544.1 type VI secretion system contractile sheath large subunit [Rahnella perminowiae]MCR9003362.1 type VI secretion system contrac